MAACGPKRTFCDCGLESAFGDKADISQPLLIDLDLCGHALNHLFPYCGRGRVLVLGALMHGLARARQIVSAVDQGDV
jgi:hypothetical protein